MLSWDMRFMTSQRLACLYIVYTLCKMPTIWNNGRYATVCLVFGGQLSCYGKSSANLHGTKYFLKWRSGLAGWGGGGSTAHWESDCNFNFFLFQISCPSSLYFHWNITLESFSLSTCDLILIEKSRPSRLSNLDLWSTHEDCDRQCSSSWWVT